MSSFEESEVSIAHLEAQSATSATSAIVEVALRFKFLFLNIVEVALRTKVFKICCTLIALRFQIFFRFIAQFYTLNLILFHFDRNVNKCRPSLAIICSFLSQIAKNAVFALCCEISVTQARLRFNLVRKCRSAIAELRCASIELKSSLRSCAELQKLKKLNCAFCAALLLVEKIVALCCVALLI